MIYPSYKWNLPCISTTGTPLNLPKSSLDLWLGAVEIGKWGMSEYENASIPASSESPKVPMMIKNEKSPDYIIKSHRDLIHIDFSINQLLVSSFDSAAMCALKRWW